MLFLHLTKVRVLIICSVFMLSTLGAIEIKGWISDTHNGTIRVEIDTDFIPSSGDQVTVSVETPDMGVATLEGSWVVVEVHDGYVIAEPVNPDHMQPAPGYLAFIDSKDALKKFKHARIAECLLIGDKCYSGQGMEQSYEKAFRYYKEAADLGSAKGQAALGSMYLYGKEVHRDLNKAFTLFHKAASQGSGAAENNIGAIYENGLGVQRDLSEAVKRYAVAAEKENSF